MKRQIRLTVPRYRTEATLDLLWERAGQTCEAVWNALPMRHTAFHGRRSGKELFVLVDPLSMREPENSTSECHAGDVFLIYLPPTWSDDHEDFNRSAEGIFDIAFFYGEDALIRGPQEVLAGNLFGRITEGFDAFAAACERMWLHGAEELVLEARETS